MKQLTRAFVRPIWAGAVCLSLIAMSPAAMAADAAGIATAKQILSMTGATAVFNPLIAGVVEQSRLLYLGQNPALAPDLNQIAAQIRKDLQPRLAELTDEIAKIYADAFTDAEMKEILTFYQSPVGKKLLEVQPKMTEATMTFAQNWANKLSEEVTAKMREELMRRGHKM
jgi:uncharacterized protein